MPIAVRILLLAAAVSLASASSAWAGFAPPVTVATQVDNTDQQVTTDRSGDSLASWSQPRQGNLDDVKARRMTAAGDLGPELTVAGDGDNFQQSIAFGPGGRAFAAWRHNDSGSGNTSVQGRWIEPDGSLGPVKPIADQDTNTDWVEVRVAVAGDGVASVFARDQNNGGGSLFGARRVSADSSLQTLYTISGSPTKIEAVGLPDGSTYTVWREIQAKGVYWPAGTGAPGTPDFVSPVDPNYSAADPQIAADPNGNMLVTFRRRNSSADAYGVAGRRIGPTGTLLGSVFLIDPEFSNAGTTDNYMSVNSSGRFLIALGRPEASKLVVHARVMNPDGTFPAISQPLSDPNKGSFPYAVLMTDRGTGAVGWSAFISMALTQSQGIAVDGSAAPIGGITDLLNAQALGGDDSPSAGVMTIVMRANFKAGLSDVAVSRYLLEPICADSSATVVQGKPIKAPLSCSGPAIEGASVVTPPAHGSVGALGAGPPTLGYTPTPGFEGTDSFTYLASNDGGSSNVATVTIKVGKDTVAPTIDRFRFVETTSAAQASTKKKKKRKKAGYEFRLNFSEPATAKVAVERPVRGVKKGKKCRARKRGAKGKRCTLHRSLGSVGSKQLATSSTIKLSAKLVKRIRGKGAMRAGAVATDAAGNESKVKRLTIKIRR